MDSDGGSAYPGESGSAGMSLRDWFAGMAMKGMLAGGRNTLEESVVWAYEVADRMLAERGGGQREKEKG